LTQAASLFLFSSRRRHTRFSRDWSSDVCSSDLSAAIPVMPLYIAIVYRIMKDKGLHEGPIEQLERTFREHLYSDNPPPADESNRLRLDDRELRDDVQQACRDLWPQVTTE